MLGTPRTYARLGAQIGAAISLFGAASLIIWITALGASTATAGALFGAIGFLALVIGFPVLAFSSCALRQNRASS